MEFQVTWSIEVDADSPLEAAEEAFRSQHDDDGEESLAPCFTVTGPEGEEWEIDLQFDKQRARITNRATGDVSYIAI